MRTRKFVEGYLDYNFVMFRGAKRADLMCAGATELLFGGRVKPGIKSALETERLARVSPFAEVSVVFPGKQARLPVYWIKFCLFVAW
jgi:hypothetical protein